MTPPGRPNPPGALPNIIRSAGRMAPAGVGRFKKKQNLEETKMCVHKESCSKDPNCEFQGQEFKICPNIPVGCTYVCIHTGKCMIYKDTYQCEAVRKYRGME